MNLLYWNLHRNCSLESIVSDCLEENEIDIAIFSEFQNVDFDLLLTSLSNTYLKLESFGGCQEVVVLYKTDINLVLLREQHRYLLADLERGDKHYIIVGVHLPSDLFGDRSNTRKNIIRNIVRDVSSYEQSSGFFSSIVIGDMNASPFDEELVGKDAFNAVLFKKLITQQEAVTFCDESFRRFYNPIIEYINESQESYGSYYYSSGDSSLYWYCFDQILVRKELIDSVADLRFLKKVKENELMTQTKPKEEISDHLPLFVSINL